MHIWRIICETGLGRDVDIAFVQKYLFLVCILMENLILMNMSAVFVQRPVPKSLLYSV